MTTDDFLVSIWLVDPVGGVFVDWPSDASEGHITNASGLKRAIYSNCAQHNELRTLKSLERSLPGAWIPHDGLRQLEKEILKLMSSLDSGNSVASNGPLFESLNKILAACRFAKELNNAGVHIG